MKTVAELRWENRIGFTPLSCIPEHKTWHSMRSRCFNPKNAAYHDYGGRGITVCAEWKNSFWTFLEDMGRRPDPSLTLDRINNDGNYEPGNCRWATRLEQSKNKRPAKPHTWKTMRCHNCRALFYRTQPWRRFCNAQCRVAWHEWQYSRMEHWLSSVEAVEAQQRASVDRTKYLLSDDKKVDAGLVPQAVKMRRL